MADLNPRNDSFITMLLEVSGRARPSDLHSVPLSEAPALLEAYRTAHSEMRLGFEGDTLVQQYGAPESASVVSPTPAPTLPPPAPVVSQTEPAPQPAPATPEPAAAADVAPVGAGESGVWDFTTPASPPAGPPSAPESAPPSTPAPPVGDVAAGSESLPSWVYQQEAGAQTDLTGFSAPAPPPADFVPEVADFEDLPAHEVPAPPTSPIPWWKWLLSALLPFLGFYWYFDLRRTDPEGAKRLLVFTIAAAVVLVILVAAFVVLFGALLLAVIAA